MKKETFTPPVESVLPKQPSRTQTTLTFIQIMPPILLLICTLFGIYVGICFLQFLNHEQSNRSSITNKWSETGLEQLQQMNTIIKQELDLIIDQRQENKALQAKIDALTTKNEKNTIDPSPSPSAQTGQ